MGDVKIKIKNKIIAIDEELTPKTEEYVYGYLMEVLTGGLYPNKFDVIREYVQNSYDAIIEFLHEYGDIADASIKIEIDYPSITIFDTGTGMSKNKINEYRFIGYSEKKMGKSVGFQGIGKLAGVTVAEKLIVTSSPYGVAEKYKLEFDAGKMLERVSKLREESKNITIKQLILEHTDISTSEEKEDEHYTFVELHGIKDEFKELFEREIICQYLSRTVPVPRSEEHTSELQSH